MHGMSLGINFTLRFFSSIFFFFFLVPVPKMSDNKDHKMDVDADVDADGLTKAQRKKARQKARKAAEAAEAAAGGGGGAGGADGGGGGGKAGGASLAAAAAAAGNGKASQGSSKKTKGKKKGGGDVDDIDDLLREMTASKNAAAALSDGSGEVPKRNPKSVFEQFPARNYPAGTEHDYELDLKARMHGRSEAEFIASERLLLDTEVRDLRRAAEAHRQVRGFLRDNNIMRPGMRLYDIAEQIEAASRHFSAGGPDDEGSLSSGVAFPTGLSINHIAAHDSAMGPSDMRTLGADDVMKVDIGVHVNGRIIDSAWTVHHNDKFDPLIETVREATYAGIRAAGVDVHILDIGDAVEEVLDAGEISLDGRDPVPIRAIRNLNGHSIGPYRIHAGKTVGITRSTMSAEDRARDPRNRMEEGELYAIEVFASTGKGYCAEAGECSHYMMDYDAAHVPLRLPSAKRVLSIIRKEYGTLAFSSRDLQRVAGDTKVMGGLRCLVDAGIINMYPPLVDEKGCYTAQFEHTLILRPTCKEVLSKGSDY
jgi:methionyl aminopeptidase